METNNNFPGPNFEPGPGWGHYVSRWLGKYFWPVVVPIIIVLGLYLGSRL